MVKTVFNFRSDRLWQLLMIVAILGSMVSWYYFHKEGATLAYADAQSHLMISRRVVDSTNPDYAQLGGVWLPLVHILSLTTIWFDPFYHSGMAGIMWSMLSFVLAIHFLYLIGYKMSGDRRVGAVAALIFGTNPNILYMQSTAMTEVPSYALLLGAVYCLMHVGYFPQMEGALTRSQWLLKYYGWIVRSAAFLTLATWVRYEAWVFLLFALVWVVFLWWRQGYSWTKIQGHVILFGVLACILIFVWFVYNQVTFGDWLHFQRGEYADPSLWVQGSDPVIGNIQQSVLTYGYGLQMTLGPLLIVALIGLGFYLYHYRAQVMSLAPLGLWIFIPFFIVMLYLGQRPMSVPQLTNGYQIYNTRFALITLLAAAIFAAYLTKKRPWLQLIMVVFLGVNAWYLVAQYEVITLKEPVVNRLSTPRVAQIEVAEWLRDEDNYDGGLILIESYGNELLEFESRIDLKNFIYEGSTDLWEPAVAAPHLYTEWIVMRRGQGTDAGTLDMVPDKIWLMMHDTPLLVDHFTLVYNQSGYEIWKLQHTSERIDISWQQSQPDAYGIGSR